MFNLCLMEELFYKRVCIIASNYIFSPDQFHYFDLFK